MFKNNAIMIVIAIIISYCVWVWPGQATVMGVYTGDLIKLQNDNDPSTHEDEVVYFFDKDWFRRPFPNRKVFLSWYEDFSGVKELTKEQLAEIRLGGNIVYRPGTRLVKIPSVPKVYAVEPQGVLRWIETEAVAVALYGADWAQRVDDVPESFFVNYREGAPLTAPVWPTGTVVRRQSDATLFYIDGMSKRRLPPTAAAGYRLNEAFVIAAASPLDEYAQGSEVNPGLSRYTDTSQIDYVETLPPPLVDFPVSVGPVAAGQDQTLYSFRIVSGQPVIIKRVLATVQGPLWSGAAPQLTDLRFVDVAGENLFGIRQLETVGAGTESLEWSGAYTMPADTISIIELRARVSPELPAGSVFTVSLDRDQFGLAEGGSDQPLADFYPKSDFPTAAATVE